MERISLGSRVIAIILISLSITTIGVWTLFVRDDGAQSNGITEWQWQNSTPEEQGMDSTMLDSMMNYLQEGDYAIDSVLVIRNGYLVLEEYPNSQYDKNTLHFIYSCTKSVSSTLIGIAIKEGFIANVTQKVVDFFPDRDIDNLDTRKKNITLEHLLTMSAGFEWDEWTYWYWDPQNDFNQAIESGDMVQFILDKPMANEPGTKWVYNSAVSHLLSAIVQETSGMSTLDFAKKYLFEPLGISNINWGRDSQGVYYGGYDLYMRPQDMAKIGYLFLNNGTWDGKQIISTDWVIQSTKVAFYPWGSTGYGYQWWLNPSGGYYFASGLFSQRIIIIPNSDLVVVFTAEIRSGSDPELAMVENYILPAIIENLTTIESSTTNYSSTEIKTTTSNPFKTTITDNGSFSGFDVIIFVTGLITILLIQNKKQNS